MSPRRSARPFASGVPTSARRPAPQRRRENRSGAWKSSLAVAVCLGAALLGLAPVLQGLGWWFATMSVVLVLLGVMTALRAWGAPELAVIAGGAVVWAALVLVLYAGDSLWFVFPTSGTIPDLSGDLADAGLSIAQQEVPAVADGPILQLMVMAVGLIAIVSDELATGLRAPVLGGLGPLAVLAVAPLVRHVAPNVPVYVVVALAFLLMLWCASRIGADRPRGPRLRGAGGRNPLLAAGMAVAAIAAMVVLPTITPGLTADSLAEDSGSGRFPTVYATGVDPTIQLGRDLRRSAPLLSLTYSTTSEEGLYLKMVNLGDFSTGLWEPESPFDAVGYDGQDFGTPPGLAPDVPTVQSETSVSIAALRSDWLPLPYPTQRVDELSGDWLLTPGTFTVTDLRGDTRGLNYQVTGLDIQPTAEQLAAAGAVVPDAISGFLALPPDLPPVIAETAAAVAGGAATNYDQAVALQEYFRSGEFRYSLTAPVTNGYDSDNALALADFLAQKEGYCVHFAGAMAVMARTLGIPSRIAVGYAPGRQADSVGQAGPVYEVYTDQLHTWPELYFDGIGWLPFEPTPGLDITPPDYSLPDYAQAGAPGSASTPAPSSTSTAAPNERPDILDGQGPLSPEQVALGQLRGWGVFAAILGGIAVIGLAPFTVRRLIRRRRMREIDTGALPGTLAWTELEDALDDYRVQRSAGDTLHDLDRRVREELTLPEDALERLRLRVEFEQYAHPASTDAVRRGGIRSDLEALIRALEAGASTGERSRARFLPSSLLGRLRGRRGRTASSTGSLVP
ncbi:transglutaminase family protein [Herbiconiux sp. YIM B11900]|uniref:transglutaminase family protein n=1 Tax=Herbiconiux sp. YIM B11900 TaxID=3404131 RepID=UPI003F86D54D